MAITSYEYVVYVLDDDQPVSIISVDIVPRTAAAAPSGAGDVHASLGFQPLHAAIIILAILFLHPNTKKCHLHKHRLKFSYIFVKATGNN